MPELTNSIKLGKDCELKIDGSVMKGVTSVTINCEADMIDVSTRDDYGYSKELPGKKKITVDVEAKRVEVGSGETDTQAPLYNAWKSRTPTGVSVKTAGGLLLVDGTFVVGSLEESQAFDDAVNLSVTLNSYGAPNDASGSGSGE
ncbi:MAG: hypothetical protein IK077_02190 [Thermoguttaceae bacterium]|nr:hypothetical protein [Thermoguttaceae bacterium]